MGKKTRKEREEKRESYASQRSKQKRKSILIASAVFAGIAAIVLISVYNFTQLDSSAPGAPPGAGILGDEHEHASFLVILHGDTFDFSSPAFQIKNSWIHFEGQDGTTIHRHSTGVTLGYLFETLAIGLNDECFAFEGTNGERSFCTDEDYSLKFYVNHQPVTSITDLVFEDQDRILVSYGGEEQTQIDEQLARLDAQPILG